MEHEQGLVVRESVRYLNTLRITERLNIHFAVTLDLWGLGVVRVRVSRIGENKFSNHTCY